jgi:hypothetical protein
MLSSSSWLKDCLRSRWWQHILSIKLYCVIPQKIERERVTLRLAVYRQSFRLVAKPLETHDQYIFQLNTCGFSPYITSCMTRGWICRLQLVLVLAIAAILGFESRGTHDHILVSRIRDSPNFVWVCVCVCVCVYVCVCREIMGTPTLLWKPLRLEQNSTCVLSCLFVGPYSDPLCAPSTAHIHEIW